jgi:hypothetical protein
MNSHIDPQLSVCPYMYATVVRLGAYPMYAWEIIHGLPHTKIIGKLVHVVHAVNHKSGACKTTGHQP